MKSKQRKKVYVQTLECNIQKLQFEAAALIAQLELWKVNQHDSAPLNISCIFIPMILADRESNARRV